jgi:hypothetical protein
LGMIKLAQSSSTWQPPSPAPRALCMYWNICVGMGRNVNSSLANLRRASLPASPSSFPAFLSVVYVPRHVAHPAVALGLGRDFESGYHRHLRLIGLQAAREAHGAHLRLHPVERLRRGRRERGWEESREEAVRYSFTSSLWIMLPRSPSLPPSPTYIQPLGGHQALEPLPVE